MTNVRREFGMRARNKSVKTNKEVYESADFLYIAYNEVSA